MSPRRRTAWHTYLLLTCGLLVAVRTLPPGERQIAIEFAAVSAQIRQHARIRGADGVRLSALVRRAWSMERAGDRAGSGILLRVLAQWLFQLSRGERLRGTVE